MSASPKAQSTLERAGALVLIVGMVFAPLSGVRAISPPPVISVADVLLVAGFALLMPVVLTRKIGLPFTYIVGAAIFASSILLTTVAAIDAQVNLPAVRVIYVLIGLPLLFTQWNPNRTTLMWIAGAYVAGALTSLGYGIIEGVDANERYAGLATHPNALGHSLALSAALLPFLASGRRGRQLWWLPLVGFACLFGVWESGSRASLLALGALLVVYVVIESSAFLAFWAVLLSGFVAIAWDRIAMASNENALTRLLGGGGAQESDEDRFYYVQLGLQRFSENPILGDGFADMRLVHNTYLQVLVAVGMVGFIGFLMMLVAMTLPLVRRSNPRHVLAYPVVVLLSVGAVEVLWETMHWAALSLVLLAYARPGPPEGEPGAEDAVRASVSPQINVQPSTHRADGNGFRS